MEIESKYKKVVETKGQKSAFNSQVEKYSLAFFFSLSWFSVTQLSISIISGDFIALFGELTSEKWGIVPPILGLTLGQISIIICEKGARRRNSRIQDSITGLHENDDPNISNILYGNFHVGDSGCYLPSLETKFPHNPLLNPYKIEETLSKTKAHYILKQEVTETPLAMWSKTMEAIENESQMLEMTAKRQPLPTLKTMPTETRKFKNHKLPSLLLRALRFNKDHANMK